MCVLSSYRTLDSVFMYETTDKPFTFTPYVCSMLYAGLWSLRAAKPKSVIIFGKLKLWPLVFFYVFWV